MKTKIKKTEDINVTSGNTNDCVVYISPDGTRHTADVNDLKNIESTINTIDWESRRYELTKITLNIMKDWLEQPKPGTMKDTIEYMCSCSVAIADLVIDNLKNRIKKDGEYRK